MRVFSIFCLFLIAQAGLSVGRLLAGDLVISEIMAHPAPSLGDPQTGEYLEILNTGQTSIDLADFVLATPGGRRQNLIPWAGPSSGLRGQTLLEPGKIALVTSPGYNGCYRERLASFPENQAIHLTVTGSRLAVHGLANGAGAIFLEDKAGKLHDAFAWHEDAGEAVSWERKNPYNPSDKAIQACFGGSPARSLSLGPQSQTKRLEILYESGRPEILFNLLEGETGSLVLTTISGRFVTQILSEAGGPGEYRVFLAEKTPLGQKIPFGRYLISAKFSSQGGGPSHVTKLLRLFPRP